MRQVIKKVTALTLILVMGLSLAACGSKEDNGNGTKEGNGNRRDEEQVEEYALSECFSTDCDSIWYLTQNDAKGKDSEVDCIFVSSGGTMHIYDVDDYKLGDFSQMTDEEIISMLEADENASIQPFTEKAETDIARCDELIANLPDTMEFNEFGFSGIISGFENIKTALQAYRDSISSLLDVDVIGENDLSDVQYAVYTDSTGNNVSDEKIEVSYTYYSFHHGETSFLEDLEGMRTLYEQRLQGAEWSDVDDDSLIVMASGPNFQYTEVTGDVYELNLTGINDEVMDDAQYSINKEDRSEKIENITTGLSTFQVYDSYYGGYYCEGYEQCLITRTALDSRFILDDLNTDNIMIDPDEGWHEEERDDKL